MEFVISTTGNDNFVFEQTLLFMRTKYRSKRTHKSSIIQPPQRANPAPRVGRVGSTHVVGPFPCCAGTPRPYSCAWTPRDQPLARDWLGEVTAKPLGLEEDVEP